MFLEQLLIVMEAPQDIINNVANNLYNKTFILKIIELIRNFGIENYKKYVDIYNEKLKEQQMNGSLLTPEEIINNSDLHLRRNN